MTYQSDYFSDDFTKLLLLSIVDTVFSSATSVLNRVKRNAFIKTEMELSAIAAAAIIGFKNPKAASGIPRQL